MSNIGVQVVPLLTVFQTLPDATATYQMLDFLGFLTMSLIRPERWAGPMFLNFSPEKVSAVSSDCSLVADATATGENTMAKIEKARI
ncbi:MAG: hypothetical protein ACYSU5_16305 [Planctomycetota bacterium]